MKFRKKPVIIEAFKWTGDVNQTEDPTWIVEAIDDGTVWFEAVFTEEIKMMIKALGGTHVAKQGDYIIQEKGRIYPCGADVFERTYEIVDEFASVDKKNNSITLDIKLDKNDISDIIDKMELEVGKLVAKELYKNIR